MEKKEIKYKLSISRVNRRHYASLTDINRKQGYIMTNFMSINSQIKWTNFLKIRCSKMDLRRNKDSEQLNL